MYHSAFYGENSKDPDLLLNHPAGIRSDEWIVNSQKTIAQKNNGFSEVNPNLGNGEDVSLLYDLPYKGWTELFKPHNIGFLVLPFDIAFALHWWILAYLLVLSCYFFVLLLLPKKFLLAALLSIGFLCSPFIQWWYLYATLGSVYYALFGIVTVAMLLRSKKRSHTIAWAALLSYITVAFALVLYPPFQIPCALAALFFTVGYFLNIRKTLSTQLLRTNLLFGLAAIMVAGLVIGLALYQKQDIVKTINNTAYPGQRIVHSGGYNAEQLISGNLSPLLQITNRASHYLRPEIGAVNQSEAANFILLAPFILPFLLFITWKKYRRNGQIDYMTISMTILAVILCVWLFVPGLDLLGKFSLLNKVPPGRLILGVGLVNFILLILFIRSYATFKKSLTIYQSLFYALIIFVFYLLVNLDVARQMPEFIGYKSAILLALPTAVIVFLFLRKWPILAISALLAFSYLSIFHIHPLYRGTEVLTQTPLVQAIQQIGKTSDKKWVGEDLLLENFTSMSGVPSLTGVYMYPQLNIWNNLTKSHEEKTYNRYAHVNFNLDRNPATTIPSSFTLVSPDQFRINAEPCNDFFKQNNVGFLLSSGKFAEGDAPCLTVIKVVSYPQATYYIYRVNF
jgi:hypothetical protein